MKTELPSEPARINLLPDKWHNRSALLYRLWCFAHAFIAPFETAHEEIFDLYVWHSSVSITLRIEPSFSDVITIDLSLYHKQPSYLEVRKHEHRRVPEGKPRFFLKYHHRRELTATEVRQIIKEIKKVSVPMIPRHSPMGCDGTDWYLTVRRDWAEMTYRWWIPPHNWKPLVKAVDTIMRMAKTPSISDELSSLIRECKV
ncbi:MAG TPA: hypothetical protein VKU00_05255 [Chthonomonadaceae bacterium]|nr:hypothetical protein [Chthonomonadaceae bacterium]